METLIDQVLEKKYARLLMVKRYLLIDHNLYYLLGESLYFHKMKE